MSAPSAVDDYFEGLDASTRAVLAHIRDLVIEMVPDAQQGTSYGMPAMKYMEKPLLGLLAAKDHLSIFPFSPRVVDAVREQLTDFGLSKGTIRFTANTPIPDEVVRQIISLRVDEIAGTAR